MKKQTDKYECQHLLVWKMNSGTTDLGCFHWGCLSSSGSRGVVGGWFFMALPTPKHQQKPLEAAWIWQLPNQTSQVLLNAFEELA